MQTIFDILKVILVGIVEGITEWLPVSSTGHMILVEDIFPIVTMSDNFYKMFIYVIQLGAILAVVVYYFNRLNPFSKRKGSAQRASVWSTWLKVLIGVIPAGFAGLALDDFLDEKIFADGVKSYVVAAALLVYGIIFILVEKQRQNKAFRVNSIEELSYKEAFYIGCFQVLSIIPGTSRSGSTIIGSMMMGISRTVAAEFSFFMAIPIMAGVSILKTGKYAYRALEGTPGYSPTSGEITMLAVGMVVAFFVSLAVIKFLLDFVKKHSFTAFGWYRIVLAVLVFLYFIFA